MVIATSTPAVNEQQFQLERYGYFAADRIDHVQWNKPVLVWQWGWQIVEEIRRWSTNFIPFNSAR